jgi:hypothetical protein
MVLAESCGESNNSVGTMRMPPPALMSVPYVAVATPRGIHPECWKVDHAFHTCRHPGIEASRRIVMCACCSAHRGIQGRKSVASPR